MLSSILVDKEKGLVDRSIFVDPEIYKQELELVFGRCWLFLGHESQINKPNDFMANYMGEDPVLVTRDAKGKLHAFLNMCRHRGNRICRADYGNAPSFMCTYHGWTFATDGKLVGVPGYKEAYFEELDRSQWGLVEAGQIDSYKGMIFATWDKHAPTLADYLGDMAWYIDPVVDRRAGGAEIIGGIHKWVMDANWKFAADNFGGDGYHFPITHGAGVSLGILRPKNSPKGNVPGHCVSPGNGHGVVGFGTGDSRDYQLGRLPREVSEYIEQHLPEMEQRLGRQRALRVIGGVSTTFPNMSLDPPVFTARIWHPRGPEKTEVWSYCLVDKDAPASVKQGMARFLTYTFGPSGGFEQDDMNNFIQCTQSGKTSNGKKVVMNLQLGLGHESTLENIPGRIAPSPSENNQRAFYAWWQELMSNGSWDKIKLTPKSI